MTKPVRVGLKSCYVPEEACYILLVDGELVYHSFTEEGAIFHMKDLIENLDKKFRKQIKKERNYSGANCLFFRSS